ncbi:MAG: ThiF family adenylyltransferase [Deltaproteobacteria bacterium]|nr:ThiF family adenylyltransferase [Deltaproteobacteria bacterium]
MRPMDQASFTIIGLGGLGTPLALALAASGARRLVLVDDDVVDLSNLQRQVLYRTEDVGRPKGVAAKEALIRRGVPASRIEVARVRFNSASARGLLHDSDVACDGSDNLQTKFLVNDACVAVGRRFVIAGVVQDHGQVFPVRPGHDACYRCLFEAPPAEEIATCAEAGVLGATCGHVAAIAARAAMALAMGEDPKGILGKAWLIEAGTPRSIVLRPRPDCQACGIEFSEKENQA